MVAACFCFTAMTALARHVSAEVHPVEIAFFRNVFGLVFMLPWLAYAGLSSLHTRRFGLHVLRAIAVVSAVMCWFTAVSLMPLAEVTALGFVAPLFAAVGAGLFLGERVGVRRWSAIIVGFAGAMVILRPGIQAVTLPAVLALTSAVLAAVSMLFLKSLSRTDPANTIVVYLTLLMTVFAVVPALMVWTTPSAGALAWMAAIGLSGTLAQLCYVRAFRAADASTVLPFSFFKLLFAALFGFVFFAQRPDAWTWIGAGIIFGSTLYTAHREARAERAAPTAIPVPEAAVVGIQALRSKR